MVNLLLQWKGLYLWWFCHFLPIYFSDSIVIKNIRSFVQNFQIMHISIFKLRNVDEGIRDEMQISKGHRTHDTFDKNS